MSIAPVVLRSTTDRHIKKTQFQPGVSGNPNGRPTKEASARYMAQRLLDETREYYNGTGKDRTIVAMPRRERLLDVLIRKCEQGNMTAMKIMVDRLWPVIHHSKNESIAVGPKDVLEVLAALRERTGDGVEVKKCDG